MPLSNWEFTTFKGTKTSLGYVFKNISGPGFGIHEKEFSVRADIIDRIDWTGCTGVFGHGNTEEEAKLNAIFSAGEEEGRVYEKANQH